MPIRSCRIEPDDVTLALFTSGTTGTLKAAQHSQASYAAVVHNVLSNLIDPAPGEIMLHAASMIHASGTFVLPYWLRGGTAAILPGFTPASYLEAIERWRPTALNLVPTMLQMLFQLPGIEAADLSSVETILYGASPMPRPVLEKALALWGPVFVQYYGQTEAPLAICALSKQDHVGASAGAAALLRPAERRMRAPPGRRGGRGRAAGRARRDRAARALRDEGLYRRRAERGELPSRRAGCAPATSAASTTRAI